MRISGIEPSSVILLKRYCTSLCIFTTSRLCVCELDTKHWRCEKTQNHVLALLSNQEAKLMLLSGRWWHISQDQVIHIRDYATQKNPDKIMVHLAFYFSGTLTWWTWWRMTCTARVGRITQDTTARCINPHWTPAITPISTWSVFFFVRKIRLSALKSILCDDFDLYLAQKSKLVKVSFLCMYCYFFCPL